MPSQTPVLDLAPTVIRGLAELGPCGPSGEDLCLQLGLSLWMNRAGADLHAARATMLAMRQVVLEVGGIDAKTEPIPLVGLSPRLDALNLAAYLGDLVMRAARSARCETALIADRVIEQLDRTDTAPASRVGRKDRRGSE